MTGRRQLPSVIHDIGELAERARAGSRKAMRRYIIERTAPGAGQMGAAALAALAGASNTVLRDIGPTIQWVHSYVTDDRITCIYLAEDEKLIREHARWGGFAIDSVDLIH